MMFLSFFFFFSLDRTALASPAAVCAELSGRRAVEEEKDERERKGPERERESERETKGKSSFFSLSGAILT